MDAQQRLDKVRAAVDAVLAGAHGLVVGAGGDCRMVPVELLDGLVDALEEDEPAVAVSGQG